MLALPRRKGMSTAEAPGTFDIFNSNQIEHENRRLDGEAVADVDAPARKASRRGPSWTIARLVRDGIAYASAR